MMTPEFLKRITERAERVAEELHVSMIKKLVHRITLRLGREDKKFLGGRDRNELETMQEAGKLREDLEIEIAKQTGIQLKEIKKEIERVGVETIKYPAEVYEKVGISKEAQKLSPTEIRIAQRNELVTRGEWKNLTRTTADQAQKKFIEECDKAYNAVSNGNMSYKEAYYQALENISKDGLTVTYTKGNKQHVDSIETATLRALRTGLSQMSAEITLTRMKELNYDTIEVSSHLGARNTNIPGKPYANHESWQGKLYSRTGKDKDLPDFVSSTGYGTGEGLCGWNCRHTIAFGDKDYPPKKDDANKSNRRYQLEQQQRALERAIRKEKRAFAVWEQALKDNPNAKQIKDAYKQHLEKLQSMNLKYQNFCKVYGLPMLEERLKVQL